MKIHWTYITNGDRHFTYCGAGSGGTVERAKVDCKKCKAGIRLEERREWAIARRKKTNDR